jgi:hypothetical protein
LFFKIVHPMIVECMICLGAVHNTSRSFREKGA